MSQLEYRVEVKEHEEGFAFIELPLELLEELGWQIDDESLILIKGFYYVNHT